MSAKRGERWSAVRSLVDTVSRYGRDAEGSSLDHWTDEILLRLEPQGAVEAETGYPSPDEQRNREIALEHAVRLGGFDTTKAIRRRAERFLLFLRDGARSATPRPRSVAPDFVHEAIDRAWATLREDESGLKALEGEDGDEDVLEVLRGATDEDLRRASFVAQILRTLAQATRAARG